MLACTGAIATEDELVVPPNSGAHKLTEDSAGTWSMTLSKNWRLAFRINGALSIEDMDLEDYH